MPTGQGAINASFDIGHDTCIRDEFIVIEKCFLAKFMHGLRKEPLYERRRYGLERCWDVYNSLTFEIVELIY